ncbi:hypothetical protein OOU_Y34scaffold00641g33 [Pyricularia oryzae Y34]|uniref:Uncharacterized protein n=2 Tax=Pyricularia oryzae TaxID=318829 RepID=A0AA97NV43_PYRO3|nr:hypothetical protein OOU_Y34scaffold00641g33 [Pyricularia oryzae Y34]
MAPASHRDLAQIILRSQGEEEKRREDTSFHMEALDP